jgi:hypothetical protein
MTTNDDVSFVRRAGSSDGRRNAMAHVRQKFSTPYPYISGVHDVYDELVLGARLTNPPVDLGERCRYLADALVAPDIGETARRTRRGFPVLTPIIREAYKEAYRAAYVRALERITGAWDRAQREVTL